ATATAMAAAFMRNERFMVSPPWWSMRKRPQSQLFLSYGPETGQAVRLDDQEEHDQRAENHEFDVGDGRGGQRDAERRGQLVQHERKDHDEGGAQEGAEDRSQSADDHHEEQLERAV